MIIDFDVPKSEHAIKKQRMVTNIITSQTFIEWAAKEAEKKLENVGPYVYHSPNERFIEKKEEVQSAIVKRRTLFSRNRT